MNQKNPYSVFIRKGDDLLVMRFSDLLVSTAEFDTQGPEFTAPLPYQAFIYSESGVYRPGDTAHIGVLVRNAQHIAPEPAVPLVAQILDPRRKVYQRMKSVTNPAGLALFEVTFPLFAATGKYEFQLEIGGSNINNHTFNVEEFVPERMKVAVSAKEAQYLPEQAIPLTIEANYLFGAKASGENAELSCTLQEAAFKPKTNTGYHYTVWRKEAVRPVALETLSGSLDKDGKITLQCPAPANFITFKGPAMVLAAASVFESGSGRTTTGQVAVPIHPAKTYIGLKPAVESFESNAPVSISGILVDWDGNKAGGEHNIEITVNRVESEWIWEYDEITRNEKYSRYLRELTVKQTNLKAKDSEFSYILEPESNAEGYVIYAKSGKNMVTSILIKGSTYADYIYRGERAGDGDYSKTTKALQPESIMIKCEGEITAKEKAKAVIYPPYPGKMLVSIETDTVLQSEWLTVDKDPVTYEFTVDKFYPNIYLSAFLIRKTDNNPGYVFLPGRSFGITPVKMKPVVYTLETTLTVPEKIRPGSELTVTVETEEKQEDVYATIAVVDEGILQLTRFKSPNPFLELFKQRGHTVNTYETFGWTLRIPPVSTETPGGGGGDETDRPEGRITPFKPVILFSGIVKLPAGGKGEIKFKIPEFRGSLRVMAVTANSRKIGRAEKSVTVTEPVVLQTTIPRFLIAEDNFSLPVFVTNLTGSKGTFSIQLEPGKSAKTTSAAVQKLTLAPNISGTVYYDIRVTAATGAAEFKITAAGNNETSVAAGIAPIIPDAPVLTETKIVFLKEGDNELISYFKGWNPQYEKSKIWVTANKYSEQFSHLKYLVRYPYGCIEQTTSSTRPLLFIGNLLNHIDPEFIKSSGIEEKYMHGANRLLSMQTIEGGFSYWPGEQAPTYWGTAYAGHTLILGIRAGYPVPQERVNEALAFMETTLDNINTRSTDAKYGYSIPKSEPYMQYVLALAGRGRKGRIKQLIDNPPSGWEELYDENLYLLKAALYITGDRTYEPDLKKLDTSFSGKRTNNWSFWSELRSRGMVLDTFEQLFPGGKEAENLADSIASQLKKESFSFTTQELSWCTSSLGRRLSGVSRSWSRPVLYVDGKVLNPAYAEKNSKIMDVTYTRDSMSAAQSVNMKVQKISSVMLYAVITVEGIKPEADYITGNHNIRVNRTYYTGDGNETDPDSIRLGDLVFVEITLANISNESIRNIALVDRFAAGLEIENTRLNRSHAVNWTKDNNLWDVQYMNIRDDRIEFFGHLDNRNTVNIYYVLRAVTAGEYHTPPIKAEAMYDPGIWSLADDYRSLTILPAQDTK